MSKYIVQSISELHQDQDRLKKGFKQDDIKLTKDELKQLLDVTIENRCRYKLMKFYDLDGLVEVATDSSYPGFIPEKQEIKPLTEAEINDIAENTYKQIVSDFKYDSNIVLATRAVKFNEDYVKEIVRACNKKYAAKAKRAQIGKSEMVNDVLLVSTGELLEKAGKNKSKLIKKRTIGEKIKSYVTK